MQITISLVMMGERQQSHLLQLENGRDSGIDQEIPLKVKMKSKYSKSMHPVRFAGNLTDQY